MLIENVRETIAKHCLIEKDTSIVVGVSGGPDSVCLLHVLFLLSRAFNLKIYAVHINHLLRGDESDQDEQFVSTLCKKLNIELFTKSIDIQEIAKNNRVSIEEAGREARYREFDKIADEVGAEKIAVAHNRNDQAETIIMNLVRGAGLNGLKGMDYKRQRIIRPLLDIDRQDIEEYCAANLLSPRVDSSNLKSIYTRNKIRLELVPYINEMFNLNITDSILRMSRLLKEDHHFIEGYARDIYNESILEKNNNEILLDIHQLVNSHPSIRKRIVQNAIKDVNGDLKGMENIHIEDAVKLLIAGRTGALLHLPKHIHVRKSYNIGYISKNVIQTGDGSIPFIKQINVPGITELECLGACLEAEIIDKPHDLKEYMVDRGKQLKQFFDYEKLKQGIYIRNRRDGDRIKPLKSRGTKKLKEFLIDNKIPREIRDRIPLVAKENEIVWMIGYKTSDKFKVTENTKYVVLLSYVTEQ